MNDSEGLEGLAGPGEQGPTEASGMEEPAPAARLRNLHHELVNGRDKYTVKIDELHLPHGQFIAILGSSGCGKTTLLTILGLARQPFREGNEPAVKEYQIFDYRLDMEQPQRHDILGLYAVRSRKIEELRRELLGFCLQNGELLPNLTVQENVEMPMHLNGWPRKMRKKRAREVLEMLGGQQPSEVNRGNQDDEDSEKLWERRRFLPHKLSGGEYQRVALARALSHRPQILFLDEPTGSLDPNTAKAALEKLARMREEEGITVVMITHNPELANDFASYIIRMHSPERGFGTIESFSRKDEASGDWVTTDASWRMEFTLPQMDSSRDG